MKYDCTVRKIFGYLSNSQISASCFIWLKQVSVASQLWLFSILISGWCWAAFELCAIYTLQSAGVTDNKYTMLMPILLWTLSLIAIRLQGWFSAMFWPALLYALKLYLYHNLQNINHFQRCQNIEMIVLQTQTIFTTMLYGILMPVGYGLISYGFMCHIDHYLASFLLVWCVGHVIIFFIFKDQQLKHASDQQQNKVTMQKQIQQSARNDAPFNQPRWRYYFRSHMLLSMRANIAVQFMLTIQTVWLVLMLCLSFVAYHYTSESVCGYIIWLYFSHQVWNLHMNLTMILKQLGGLRSMFLQNNLKNIRHKVATL